MAVVRTDTLGRKPCTTEATPTSATAPVARAKAVKPQKMHTCPECGERFSGSFDAKFCSVKHKQAFHNRSAKRGVVMIPLIMAWRGGRGGTEQAKWAYSELCRLADFWKAEDKAAGRMDAQQFVTPKMRDGWSAVDYAFG
jgi:hypothetical protein